MLDAWNQIAFNYRPPLPKGCEFVKLKCGRTVIRKIKPS